MRETLRVAVVVGLIRGVFEWLPVSSEGNMALYLTVVEGLPETAAVQYALFLHAGTALAAALYYRGEILAVLRTLPRWRPGGAFADRERADVSFLTVATLVPGGVGASPVPPCGRSSPRWPAARSSRWWASCSC